MLPEVRKAPVRGAYHYFLTALDPIAQATHFWATVKDQGYHFLAVDYEGNNNNLDRAGQEKLKRFIMKLRSLTDMYILLYTSPYIFRDNVQLWEPEFWNAVPLWLAHWNGQDPQNGSPSLLEAPGWILWQYTSDPLDQNVFNGDVEDLRAWVNLDQEEDMENKKWYESRTLWFFILTLLVSVAGLFGFAEFELDPGQAELIGVIVSVIGVILRAFTKQGIEL